jgi:hypothetical protein
MSTCEISSPRRFQQWQLNRLRRLRQAARLRNKLIKAFNQWRSPILKWYLAINSQIRPRIGVRCECTFGAIHPTDTVRSATSGPFRRRARSRRTSEPQTFMARTSVARAAMPSPPLLRKFELSLSWDRRISSRYYARKFQAHMIAAEMSQSNSRIAEAMPPRS